MAEAKQTKGKTPKKAKEAQLIVEANPTDIEPEKSAETSMAEEQAPDAKEEKPTAKAGKRSAKAEREVQEKKVKEEKKADTASPDKPAGPRKKPTRPKHERSGKNYRQAYALIDRTKAYSLAEALELVTKTSTTKFDATVELHINLGVDPRQADQNVRGTVSLPAGTGKTLRIAVLAEDDDAKASKSAGADIAGSDEILSDLEKEKINFDVLISTPALMARLGKYARLLGPRGLMPNPKSGTVTTDVVAAVKEAKAGRVEYRVDSYGIIHVGIGKVSFGAEKLNQNAEAVMASVRAAKPSSLKANYLKSAYATSTMGPSIKFSL